MNNTTRQRVPTLVAALVLGAMAMDANAQISGYWQDQSGGMVRSGTGMCVRNGNWTPELATADCEPNQTPSKATAPAETVPEASAAVAPAPAPAPMPVTEKVTMDANALFDFDKSVIKPKGKVALDEVVRKLNLAGAELVYIVTTGHTDSTGSEGYNMALSMRRAEAVKTYLISKGIDGDHIKTVGKGESQPIVSNVTAEGRAKNRHVVIEVSSTRTTQ